jgi:hypothetical protein
MVAPKFSEFDAFALISRFSLQIQNSPAPTFETDLILGALSKIALNAIEELSKLADKGNPKAVEMIYDHANLVANYFGEFCNEKPELFVAFARKRLFWPGLISRQNAIVAANKKLMDKLELGADVKTIDRKGKWSLDAPEIDVALELHGTMEVWREEQQPESIRRHKAKMEKLNKEIGRPANYRPPLPVRRIPTTPEWEEEFRLRGETRKMAKNLPLFNKLTSEKWFKASWPLFLARYGKEFQNNKSFTRFIPIAQKSATKEGKKLRGILRRYIKQRILEAFKIIAPEVELKTKS